ncbi:MAG: Phosphoglycerate kinase [Methanomicrobiales archaeon]|nr:Phosphoglycerate kinase [Methanomicrobiales archaeon]MDD1639739.1 phosphoglycerate kinase [Methanomicrobiales archaeon]MDD1645121.1 phosphoglycerate kinase [Methanomicrobiales archaeon]
MTGIGTLAQVDPRGKTVLLRLDLNSPMDPSSKEILDDKRFREHLPTIRHLSESRLVILTHQSRPGKKDFTTLSAHAEKLSHLLGQSVTYVEDIIGACAREALRAEKPGGILMLENVRFAAEENLTLSPEAAAKTHLVRVLSSMADLFVNDAFGTAHRSQPTVVGLPLAMRSVGGLLMEKEVANLSRVLSGAPRPVCFVLGGTKVDDSIGVARHVLEAEIADTVIVTGVVANVFLAAAGHRIGDPCLHLIEKLEYTGEIGKAKDLLARYPGKILIPETVAVRKGTKRAEVPVTDIPKDLPVLDIGTGAVEKMEACIGRSGTVVFNGPAGVFEDPEFALGTHELLRAASRAKFSVVGGGHTAAVIEKMGLTGRFTHISTGGGACIEFLTGKKLPAIEALELSKKKFG